MEHKITKKGKCSCGWEPAYKASETIIENLQKRHLMLSGVWPYSGMHPAENTNTSEWPYIREGN